ncbi:hypothetical protein MAM1_0107d05463 [Mucor ambiguus]|uniref:Uncharacterized protein n=1 Tax=Mucor ambiguus TaxID=91626 RepID=A0A0C9MRP9_9FUNG|nr:hypothetical protein MAM1_0107d05463 [Mucor ambiguus]
METEWITQNDPKNRLIFSPFIEGLCQRLIARDITNLEREKKYLLLYLDKTAIHLLSFQMQSAKELIAVSKKLAASDFLLVPTDLGDSVSIHLDVLIKLAPDYKMHCGLAFQNIYYRQERAATYIAVLPGTSRRNPKGTDLWYFYAQTTDYYEHQGGYRSTAL